MFAYGLLLCDMLFGLGIIALIGMFEIFFLATYALVFNIVVV
jgi:hypothetical protein